MTDRPGALRVGHLLVMRDALDALHRLTRDGGAPWQAYAPDLTGDAALGTAYGYGRALAEARRAVEVALAAGLVLVSAEPV